MAGATDKSEPVRLEDFMALAREGKEVLLSVELKKMIVTQKVHPYEAEEMKSEIDMYLLAADFLFTVGRAISKVSKIYVTGIVGEPKDTAKQNIFIANTRLKLDYKRLEDSHIKFEKKYWE